MSTELSKFFLYLFALSFLPVLPNEKSLTLSTVAAKADHISF